MTWWTLSPPGFGAPLPEDFVTTFEGYRDWLEGRLDGIGGPIDLIGHDWGGGHVVNAVMHRPELVRSWTSDGAGIFDADYEWHDMAQVWADTWCRLGTDRHHDERNGRGAIRSARRFGHPPRHRDGLGRRAERRHGSRDSRPLSLGYAAGHRQRRARSRSRREPTGVVHPRHRGRLRGIAGDTSARGQSGRSTHRSARGSRSLVDDRGSGSQRRGARRFWDSI